MTQFSQFELVYNQLTNLSAEITELIKREDFSELESKLRHKDSLLKKYVMLKKTIVCSDAETLKIKELEEILAKKEEENIKILSKIQLETGAELRILNKKSKLSNVYSGKEAEANSGSILDWTE